MSKKNYKTRLMMAASALLLAFSMQAAKPALASDNKAMDADIHKIELAWEHVKFAENGASDQFDHLLALEPQTEALVAKYPGRAEPLIWAGIVESEAAGMASMLSAMGYAKKAKKILEQAYAISPTAMDSGAPTSLGVLYYRVPGFPVGFGDTKKARELLEQAVKSAPDGLDANYFYGDYLMDQKDYKQALVVLKHALDLPAHPDRPLWDRNRRSVIKELIAKAEKHL